MLNGRFVSPRLKFDVRSTSYTETILRDAIRLTHLLEMTVEIELKGVTIRVTRNSDLLEVRRMFEQERHTPTGALVGPCERENP